MRMLPDAAHSTSITGYGPGWVAINGERHHTALIVSPLEPVQPWDCNDFGQLQTHHFEQLLAWSPELVLFGSGSRLRFAHPSLLAALYARRVGVETMDTAAACRTFNFLAAEGRRVLAALLL